MISQEKDMTYIHQILVSSTYPFTWQIEKRTILKISYNCLLSFAFSIDGNKTHIHKTSLCSNLALTAFTAKLNLPLPFL